MLHHARAHKRKKPDAMIILCGHNDISENRRIKHDNLNKKRQDKEDPVDTYANMQNLIKELKRELPSTDLSVCQLTCRDDKTDIMNDVKETNQKLQQLSQREQIGYIKFDSFSNSHLGRKGLHPNQHGVVKLAQILKEHVATL